MTFAIACGRSTEPAQVTIPPATTHASVSALPPATTTNAPRLSVVGGDVVDLERVSSIRTLTTELVFAHAITTDTTYLWVHGEVRAFDAATSTLRWSKAEPECRSLAASSAGAYCATSRGARFFRASDGDGAIAGRAATATQVLAMGSRVLVLYADAKVEALDATNAVLGNATLPAMPDWGYGMGPLDVVGDRACGTQRSNTDTKVFCVDATPRVVWSKVSAVAGGLVRQVDDAIVIASDRWTHAVASEVLRSSDGATLLSMPSVRLAAALTTRGALDGVLACDPKVTLYDSTGTAKWTWTAQPYPAEAMRAKRQGANVIVALYDPIATGTQLLAFDAATGTLAWRGDVDSLPISHSKYSNRVELEARGRDLLLTGHESAQEFVQSFDSVTGKRLASVVRGR